MAGWCSGPESDDEPFNIKMFARKSFAFRGFAENQVDKLTKIVQQMGGICDDFPKYILTNKKFYDSLDVLDYKNYDALYNVTYIRDCVDSNRCLNIEQYRFGSKYSDKQDYKEFEPCCQNFHSEQNSCRVCDPFFLPEVQKSRRRAKSFINESEQINAVFKNDSKTKLNSIVKKEKPVNSDIEKRRINTWDRWELQLMLDYTISKNLFYWIKSPSLFKRMHAEGLLTHRSVESMRSNFRNNILGNLNSFNLPEPIKRKIKRVNNSAYPGRSASKILKTKSNKQLIKQKCRN